MSGQRTFEHVHLELLEAAQVEQHRQALGDLLAERYQVLLVLGQSVKSLVCSGLCMVSGEQVVIKRYFDEAAYAAEASGYLLFRSGPIAGMRYQDSRHQVLVLEALQGRLPVLADLPEVIAAYAAMHSTALANFQRVMGHRSTPEFLDPCLSSSCRFPSFDLQGISVGDCKAEHLLVTVNGVHILDLETYSLQRSVWFDILSLSRFLGAGPSCPWSLEEWVARYCECRKIPAHYYDLQKIRDYLQRVQSLEPGRVYCEEALS
ncbi:hypothetical protein PseBG33_2867 [Pseudomonas synxantha BG33R]|uniref:hypothetical protein n=1 Tax=Pseudomonas TaxID=286 RepID=UPI00025FDCA1|nr:MULTISPECIES: hypothetical protein [Pseudomonas]EIK72873.1 hypothetical protein PseBG33_2867 [Pseudomonas synxantha BG33R]QOY69163.1 hypothetical protein IH404_15205 [Pseudomonas sp. OST1909]WPN51382.1 hypothetical protein QMK52_21115 [Pseudomonas sp. P9_2]